MALAGACLIFVAQPLLAQAPEPDVRRDATVAAVEKVMPAVVNIATETIVNVRDPFDDLLRQFFDPYHRRQAPNSQLSLGSGVIIDEEGYVLTNDHVVRRADKIWVKVHGNETPYEAKLIASNPKSASKLLIGCSARENVARYLSIVSSPNAIAHRAATADNHSVRSRSNGKVGVQFSHSKLLASPLSQGCASRGDASRVRCPMVWAKFQYSISRCSAGPPGSFSPTTSAGRNLSNKTTVSAQNR